MTDLEQSGSRILDVWSVKLTLSLTLIFCLTKTENRSSKSLTALIHTIALSKGTIFDKKMLSFCKSNADISKIKGVVVLKGIFSETAYVCVQVLDKGTYNFTPSPPITKQTPKKPTLIRVNYMY